MWSRAEVGSRGTDKRVTGRPPIPPPSWEGQSWVVRVIDYKGGSEKRRASFYYKFYSRALVFTLNFTWHAVVWSQPVRDEPPHNLTSGVPIIESRGIRFRQPMHPRKDLGNIVNLRDAQSGHVDALWAGRAKVFVEMRSCLSPK